MTTIKSYTDLEQSRKLVDILPIETADMCWTKYTDNGDVTRLHATVNYGIVTIDYPCWSLASLLNVIPKDESIDCSLSFGYYNGNGEYIEKWLCTFEKEDETKDGFIIETIDGDNPIDVLYEMILKLKELNLI